VPEERGGTFSIGDPDGRSKVGERESEIRSPNPLNPGERIMYVMIAATGTLESVTVGSGEQAKTHRIATPLALGKTLVVSYEADGKVSTRTE
jgi:hypothetical protein